MAERHNLFGSLQTFPLGDGQTGEFYSLPQLDRQGIGPLVPVDLVIDHSVQVDFAETSNALELNMQIEFKRNRARYQFLKWGMQSFNGFNVIPPGIGIVHQVNLEYLARGVIEQEGLY